MLARKIEKLLQEHALKRKNLKPRIRVKAIMQAL
jgi:hypothetical protein